MAVDEPTDLTKALPETDHGCRTGRCVLAAKLALAEESRRREIAENLHDHLGLALAMMRTKLKGLQGDAVFSGLYDDIESIGSLLDQAIRYTRNLTFELSPPVLYELGLEPALEWLAEFFMKKHRLPVEFKGSESDGRRVSPGTGTAGVRLDREIEILLFCSVRELLFNVVKHAAARNASLSVRIEGEYFSVSVADDGAGFPEKTENSDAHRGNHGFGLFSIRERMHHLNGTMTIESAPGKGSSIRLKVPLSRSDGHG